MGCILGVNPSGSKLWRFKYRLDGKENLLSIGAYPAISLAQARQARDAARAEVAAGGDTSEAKQEEKRARRESQRLGRSRCKEISSGHQPWLGAHVVADALQAHAQEG